MEEDPELFSFCDKIDLHATEISSDLDLAISVASEHGFRSIIVQHGKLEQLVKKLSKISDTEIIPCCMIDYPFGSSSLDVRAYSILSAKEKGAKEVEIIAPYYLYAERDFHKIYDDLQNILSQAKKSNITVKYVLDQNSPYFDDSIRAKLCRTIASAKTPIISVSSGFFENDTNHSENVLMMRNIKNKTGASIKIYINTKDPMEFSLYPKAGADFLGLHYKNAANVVHSYEQMVAQKDS